MLLPVEDRTLRNDFDSGCFDAAEQLDSVSASAFVLETECPVAVVVPIATDAVKMPWNRPACGLIDDEEGEAAREVEEET